MEINTPSLMSTIPSTEAVKKRSKFNTQKESKLPKIIKEKKVKIPKEKKIKEPKPTTVIESKRIDCSRCGSAAWSGPSCTYCPLYQMEHTLTGVGEGPVDFFVISESPPSPHLELALDAHQPWSWNAEKHARKIVWDEKAKTIQFSRLQTRFTYAVKCAEAKPNGKTIACCTTILQQEILQHARPDQPIFILALGPVVLRTLGIPIHKYRTMQGKLIEATLNGRRLLVYPTVSTRQLADRSGFIDLFIEHLKLFLTSTHNIQADNKTLIKVPIETLAKHYIYPKTLEEVSSLIDYIIGYTEGDVLVDRWPIAFDTETNTLNPHRAKLKLLTFIVAWAPGRAASIAVEHVETPYDSNAVLPLIRKLLQCLKPKIFQNGKYDIKVIRKILGKTVNVKWDTMLAEHLLHEDRQGYYGLKALTTIYVPQYSGYEDQVAIIAESLTPKAAIKKGPEGKLEADVGYEKVPLDTLHMYGAVDGDVTRQIALLQKIKIREENAEYERRRRELRTSRAFSTLAIPHCIHPDPLENLMAARALPCTNVLSDMEFHGFATDRQHLTNLMRAMDESMIAAKIAIYSMIPAGVFDGPFNPQSIPHLKKAFFTVGYKHPVTHEIISYANRIPEELLTRTKKTKEISMDKRLLRLLITSYQCPLAEVMLLYRSISKARSTFVANIEVLSREDGRMQTNFNIQGTSGGRLSSSNENLQNIPSKIGPHNIKKIFIPTDPEMVIVNLDVKATEVHIYASYSEDANLIKALNDGMDPHSFFAATSYNPKSVLAGVAPEHQQVTLDNIGIDLNHAWSYEDFSARKIVEKTDPAYAKRLDALRTNIKRVVFGILYGASEKKIGSIVGITDIQAQAIIDVLFRMFPTIPNYIEHTKNQVDYLGFVETFFGRRRRFNTKSMDKYALAKAHRQAVNFKVQSTASEIVLGVLCSVSAPLKEMFGAQLLATVHDSIVFQIHKKYISKLKDFVEEYCVLKVQQQYSWLKTKFQWDISVGPSYGEQQSIDAYLAEHPIETRENDDNWIDVEILEDLEESVTS